MTNTLRQTPLPTACSNAPEKWVSLLPQTVHDVPGRVRSCEPRGLSGPGLHALNTAFFLGLAPHRACEAALHRIGRGMRRIGRYDGTYVIREEASVGPSAESAGETGILRHSLGLQPRRLARR